MTPLSSSPDLQSRPAAAPPQPFREVMAGWATGISVVTAGLRGVPVGCTVTALASVSMDPPLLLVSLAGGSRTLAAVRATGRFGVCVLSAAQRHLGDRFAAGDPARRFAGLPHAWVRGVPVLRGSAAAAACAVERTLPVADHVLVLGRPLWHERDPAAEPAIWFDRACWRISPPAGRR